MDNMKLKKNDGFTCRDFIKLGSGAALALSASGLLPKII